MSHDRGCFKCGDDLPPRSEGCGRKDCPYPGTADPQPLKVEVVNKPGVKVVNVMSPTDLTPEQIEAVSKLIIRGDRPRAEPVVVEKKPLDITEDSGNGFLQELHDIAKEDAEGLIAAQKSYGNSWKSRGGVGAFMMLARKWDRLENRAKRPAGILNRSREGKDNIDYGPYDIFGHIILDQRAEGIIDDIRDLRRYLLLVEAEMRARGFDAKHRDNK